MGGKGAKRKRMRAAQQSGRAAEQQSKTERCFAYSTNQIDVCIINQTRRPENCSGCVHYRR